jgi:hypothetical protein
VLCTLRIPGHEFFDRIATQRATANARKHARGLAGQIVFEPAVQDGGRVTAEWRAPLFSSFSVAPDVRTRAHHDMLAAEPNQFRHAQTRLDGDGQQGPIATADPRRHIRRGEDGRDFRGVEKRDGSALVAFAGHRKNLLAEPRMRRFGDGDVPKERVNRGEARVPGATAIAALLLQMLEKPPDEGGWKSSVLNVDGVLPSWSTANRKSRRNVSRYPAIVCGLACRWRSNRSVKKPWSSDWNVAAVMG